MLLKFRTNLGKIFVGRTKYTSVNRVVGSYKQRPSEVIGHRRLDLKTIKLSWNSPFRNYTLCAMADRAETKTEDLKPPAAVRGMKVLDRNAFKLSTRVPCLNVPANLINTVMNRFRKFLLRLTGIKPVVELDLDDPERDRHKLLLFDPNTLSLDALTVEDKEFLESCKINIESFKTTEINVSYENWKYDQILAAVLPEDCEGVAGFSQVGHIVHLNLRDEILQYKKIIGEVILDKIPTARTVVNKIGTIDTVYRNFAMEVLAGDDDLIATTTEWGVMYQFDFSKVYWNPRLSTEHKRVVEDLERGDVAYDVFAGVGPFAVPAAKKGITVLANDLNPESYKWLNQNAKQKLNAPLLTFNMDGRDFIKNVVKKDLLDRWRGTHEDQKKMETPDLNRIHFFMNLPGLAVEFLDVFPGLFRDIDAADLIHFQPPKVHCYCFSKSDDPQKDAKERVENVIGCLLDESHKIRIVRNVSPNKEMLCVAFVLHKEVLFGGSEPPEKKMKLT